MKLILQDEPSDEIKELSALLGLEKKIFRLEISSQSPEDDFKLIFGEPSLQTTENVIYQNLH